jgi:twitching motility protein PilT
MSTPSAARAIDRLIDLFPPGDQQQVRMTLAGGLRLIVSQRLLPDAENKAMVAAAEVLPGVVQLWNMIRDNRTYQIPSLQQRGKELGVVRLDDSLRELVRSSKVTAAAAVAVADAPDELEASLGVRGNTAAPLGAPPPPGSSPGQVPSSARTTARERPDPKPPESKGIFDRVFKKGS